MYLFRVLFGARGFPCGSLLFFFILLQLSFLLV